MQFTILMMVRADRLPRSKDIGEYKTVGKVEKSYIFLIIHPPLVKN